MVPIARGIIFRSPMVSDVVVIIHLRAVLLSMLAGTDLVGLVHALGLGQLVGLRADKTGNGLLGEFVADRLAY